MKGFMVAAPNSNSGKTALTVAIVRALKNRGIDVRAFKSGPDFIDKNLLEIASDNHVGNLDLHMLGIEGVKKSMYLNRGELAIAEGVMGYFDGFSNSFEGSSYDIARKVNMPTVIVYTPTGEMFSAIPKLKGMVEFSGGLIKGVIFNKVSAKLYEMLKDAVEKHLNIKVFGYVPVKKEFQFTETTLGVEFAENGDREFLMDTMASILEETVDLADLIEMAAKVEITECTLPSKRDITIAIAEDEAFCFKYSDNLRLFEAIGNALYFSPLRDGALPECDLLYLSGGYQKEYAKTLSENLGMHNSIRKYAERGGKIFAECGGFEYLNKELYGFKSVGIFKGSVCATERLQNFGYHSMEINKDCILGEDGDIINVQEFHKSLISGIEGDVVFLKKEGHPMRKGGFQYKNVLGIEQYVNFLGAKKAFMSLINYMEA